MAKVILNPTETERCIESLIAVFQRYAGQEGNNCTLSKTEFLKFMNTELAAFSKNQKDPLAVDKIMKDLDQCRDGRVGFQSFFSLIAGLIIACNDYFVVHMKQKGKK
uniref:S100 calcium binding protein A10 n=1 Tax=Ornithorhynchus anatinus TaxID=9258 RepID=A0A6I8PKR0_ORNAN